jgi:hypothetical protein
MHLLLTTIVGLARLVIVVGQCFKDETMNAQWAQIINADNTSTEFSVEGSCCQEKVCGLACAEETPPPAKVSYLSRISSGYLNSISCLVVQLTSGAVNFFEQPHHRDSASPS